MDKPFQIRLLVFVVAVCALLLCWYLRRPAKPQSVPASGIVTLDGQPLDDAWIAFVPIEKNRQVAKGVTDKTGRFTLNCERSNAPGAMIGVYQVTLIKYIVGDTVKVLIPERYIDVSTSGLTAEVTPDGPNIFAFSLTTLPKN